MTTFRLLIVFLLCIVSLFGNERKIKTLYASLSPHQILEKLALFELYPNSTYGKKALKEGLGALFGESYLLDSLSIEDIGKIRDALTSKNRDLSFSEKTLTLIEQAARNLPNRKLAGYKKSEEEILAMEASMIDLSSIIFEKNKRQNSAFLDLIALYIRTKLPESPTILQLIETINTVIFYEMGFMFPPKSRYRQEVDRYTSLPEILDSSQGVCLGVSVLYIALAQRLSLPLEMITPPGHIYVRYKDEEKVINIETTALGVHIPSEQYLGLENHALKERNLKEVIGLVHVNTAAAHLGKGNFKEARVCYEKARTFIPEDPLVQELYAYSLFLTDEEEKARALLSSIKDCLPSDQLCKSDLIEDILEGFGDTESLAFLLKHSDDEEDIELLYEQTKKLHEKSPRFRALLFQLGALELKRYRFKEAIDSFTKYYAIDPKKPTVLWMLSNLHAERLEGEKAHRYFKELEEFYAKKNYSPKMLRNVKIHLFAKFP